LSTKKLFWLTMLFSLVIKCLLAAIIPLTGDEAYFFIWGKHLDFGYYDHPPMVGWFLAFMLWFGDSELLLRLPSIVIGQLIGGLIYWMFKGVEREKAYLAAILFLVSPINILNIIITTDTPLILFVFLSSLTFYFGLINNRDWLFILAGAFGGLAFLSKYFAVLLAFSYVIYVTLYQRNKKGIKALCYVFGAAIPFILINVYWNYENDWTNVVFNMITRQENETKFNPAYILAYVFSQAYLLTPILVGTWIKRRQAILSAIAGTDLKLFGILFAAPMMVFLVLSTEKNIGVHWTLSFLPFVFVLNYVVFNCDTLRRLAKWVTLFTTVHLIVIFGFLALPYSVTENVSFVKKQITAIKAKEVGILLEPYKKNFFFATESYVKSGVFYHKIGTYFSVFGIGTFHGRQDDKLTNYQFFDGKNILIFKDQSYNIDNYRPYFNRLEVKEYRIDDVPVYFILGYGFKYDVYKEEVLRPIREKFYRIPYYLPSKKAFFQNKYFSNDT
jgi:4-amino-4-deoxy-L-arabinose transferase-like glycosyltransferase